MFLIAERQQKTIQKVSIRFITCNRITMYYQKIIMMEQEKKRNENETSKNIKFIEWGKLF